MRCASGFALLLCLVGRVPGGSVEGMMMPLTALSLLLKALVRADVLGFWDGEERDGFDAEELTRVVGRVRRGVLEIALGPRRAFPFP